MLKIKKIHTIILFFVLIVLVGTFLFFFSIRKAIDKTESQIVEDVTYNQIPTEISSDYMY